MAPSSIIPDRGSKFKKLSCFDAFGCNVDSGWNISSKTGSASKKWGYDINVGPCHLSQLVLFSKPLVKS